MIRRQSTPPHTHTPPPHTQRRCCCPAATASTRSAWPHLNASAPVRSAAARCAAARPTTRGESTMQSWPGGMHAPPPSKRRFVECRRVATAAHCAACCRPGTQCCGGAGACNTRRKAWLCWWTVWTATPATLTSCLLSWMRRRRRRGRPTPSSPPAPSVGTPPLGGSMAPEAMLQGGVLRQRTPRQWQRWGPKRGQRPPHPVWSSSSSNSRGRASSPHHFRCRAWSCHRSSQSGRRW